MTGLLIHASAIVNTAQSCCQARIESAYFHELLATYQHAIFRGREHVTRKQIPEVVADSFIPGTAHFKRLTLFQCPKGNAHIEHTLLGVKYLATHNANRRGTRIIHHFA